jgi:hypothetical protein
VESAAGHAPVAGQAVMRALSTRTTDDATPAGKSVYNTAACPATVPPQIVTVLFFGSS